MNGTLPVLIVCFVMGWKMEIWARWLSARCLSQISSAFDTPLVAGGEAFDVVHAFCSVFTMAAQVFEASSYDLAVCSDGACLIVPFFLYELQEYYYWKRKGKVTDLVSSTRQWESLTNK